MARFHKALAYLPRSGRELKFLNEETGSWRIQTQILEHFLNCFFRCTQIRAMPCRLHLDESAAWHQCMHVTTHCLWGNHVIRILQDKSGLFAFSQIVPVIRQKSSPGEMASNRRIRPAEAVFELA